MVPKFILRNQELALEKIRRKKHNNQKIKVAFYVVFSSTFSSEPLYKEMLQDDAFDPMIVVIPDVSRGEKNMFDNLEKSYAEFSRKYKKTLNSYSRSQKNFVDITAKFDMICITNPYDALTHPYYQINKIVEHSILTFYVPYGPYISNSYLHVMRSFEFSCFWKIFIEQRHMFDDYCKNSQTEGENAVLLGAIKLDSLADVTIVKKNRKKVIIAPHHSVRPYEEVNFSISTFLKYYDFYLELAQLYPEIDFIFRPHPLLFVTLIRSNLWTEEMLEAYLAKIKLQPNITYQDGGDYFESFANSDALIHDCGSFIIEYLFTGKPVCYMMNGESTLNSLNLFALECLSQHYLANNKEEIIRFIENVVVNRLDNKKVGREEFFEKSLKYAYPHSAKKAFDYIKNEIFEVGAM